jgi:hypothetical protein
MRTIAFACLMGIIALVLGMLIFGRIEDEKIIFDRTTLEKVDSFTEAWTVFINQPLPVYVCGGTGFVVGGLAYLALSIGRRRRKKETVKKTSNELPGLEIVPKRDWNELKDENDLERLEAGRPFVCKVLGFVTLGLCKFYAVPQGNALVVTTFGKYRKSCRPGLGCVWSLWGFYQRPYQNKPLIQCMETTIPYERETIVTSDGLKCKLDVMISYRIEDPGKALFEVDNYENAIENVVRAALRNECGKQPAQMLHASREQIAGGLQDILEKDVEPWGIRVRLVKISNIDVPIQDGDNRFDPLYHK